MARLSLANRLFKLTATLTMLLAVLVIIVYLWIERMEAQGWAAMEGRVRELARLAQDRPSTRPILRGKAVLGNVWDEYLLVIAKANALKTTPSVVPERGLKGGASAQAIERLRKSHGALIDHLRKGTQRSEVIPPISIDSGTSRILPHVGHDPIWQGVIGYARLLIAQGDYRMAVEVLNDLALFGCDLSRNTVSGIDGAGMVIRGHALDELRSLVVDRSLPMECLQVLDEELEILDRATPERSYILLNDTAQLGRTFLFRSSRQKPLMVMNEHVPAFDWRHAFSKRLLAVALFNQVDDWNQRAGAATVITWPEAVRVHQSISVELRGRTSAFHSPGISSHAWASWARASQAKVRLLRSAVHFRLTGEVLVLGDPFGATLLYQAPERNHLKVWSLGAFDRGEPEQGPWADSDPAGKNHLVIEVDR